MECIKQYVTLLTYHECDDHVTKGGHTERKEKNKVHIIARIKGLAR